MPDRFTWNFSTYSYHYLEHPWSWRLTTTKLFSFKHSLLVRYCASRFKFNGFLQNYYNDGTSKANFHPILVIQEHFKVFVFLKLFLWCLKSLERQSTVPSPNIFISLNTEQISSYGIKSQVGSTILYMDLFCQNKGEEGIRSKSTSLGSKNEHFGEKPLKSQIEIR